MAKADMGIAMGAAVTDTAIETADAVIMDDDLRRTPELIVLSHRTHAVLWQNIILALVIKTIFLMLAHQWPSQHVDVRVCRHGCQLVGTI